MPDYLKNRVQPTNIICLLVIFILAIPFIIISLIFFPGMAVFPAGGGITALAVLLINYMGGIYYSRLVLPETVTDEGWWNRPFEAREERPIRARGFLTALLERHGDTNDQVAVVSHGAFYMEFVRVLIGVTNPRVWLTLNNTGISRFSFRENGEIALVYHNRTDHLSGDMIS